MSGFVSTISAKDVAIGGFLSTIGAFVSAIGASLSSIGGSSKKGGHPALMDVPL